MLASIAKAVYGSGVIGTDASSWPLVATCSRGLEEVLGNELRALDVESVAPGRGMVGFSGDLSSVYNANLRLRTAMRVLIPLARGAVQSREDLYQLSSSVSWPELMTSDQSLVVEVAGRHRTFRNLNFAAQVVKDAVVDKIRAKDGRRPSVDRENPDIRLHLHVSERGITSLSLDSTGEPLSHRGYRPRGGPAPLSETLAAGILLLAGYDGSEPLLDPMCGTGTFAVEASLIATQTPPGLHRQFAFENWLSHRQTLLEEVTREARRGHRDAPQPIVARDRDQRAVRATQRNLKAAWMDRFVTTEVSDALDLTLPWESGGMIVANPPYGKRIGDVKRLGRFYRGFGDRLKQHATGATAWVLCGESQLAKQIGLRTSRRIQLFNGPIECRLMRFDLWEGEKERN
ncbi:MAG: hypothetical protein GY906_06185 [bacterium]|nr:hypothetical protein [bacterium]